MHTQAIRSVLAAGLVLFSVQADAACLTFGRSTDVFEVQLSRTQAGGYFPVAALETTFNRATHGAMVFSNGKYRIGLTKNTNTASVGYQCDIDSVALTGQCSILVFPTDGSLPSRSDDVGTLLFGSCTTPFQAAPVPQGE